MVTPIKLTNDVWRETYQQRAAFARIRNAEQDYGRRLRQVARQVAELIKVFGEGAEYADPAYLAGMLSHYAQIIEPWARAVASRFIAEVSRRDHQAWSIYAKQMSRALETEVRTADTGLLMQQFLETQVQLITSLPAQAGERVHQVAIQNMFSGARSTSMEPMIARALPSGTPYQSMVANLPVELTLAEQFDRIARWTYNRSKLIARTETARVASSLTMTRAQHVGSEGYIWRTVKDQRVRETHKEMEGQFVRWDSPPVVDPGVPPYHAGMVWNCRCFPEPVVPDRYLARAWRSAA